MYIFDTLSKKKKEILNINNINIYLCGITAYDLYHIGHARVLIIFDMLIRYLNFMNFNVKYIRNITDIDDKIINKSNINNINFYSLVNNIIKKNNCIINKLNIINPNYEPKVTNFISSIIDDINILINNKKAYIKNKNVFFNIKEYKNYGILSNNKKYTFKDFIIWKNSKNNKKNSIYDYNWISPWGIGRPGWHIECSTISRFFFNRIDIHGGGIDLVFPHHENELAQSKSINKNFIIKTWMHIGSVNISGKKMSKSNNNFIYLSSLFKYFNKESIKYYLSNKDYKHPMEFSFKNLNNSNNIIKNIHKNIIEFNIYNDNKVFKNKIFKEKFIDTMNDDLNLNKIYTMINYMIKESNKYKYKIIISKNILNDIYIIMNILGLINIKNKYKINDKLIKKIEFLIKKRNDAKKNKNWIISDKIRNYLNNLGIILEDKKNNNTIWYYK